jgi:uncharacterized membrane protein
MQHKFHYYTSIGKFILKIPVIIVSLLIGLPLGFIRSCIMGAIEVSDTIMDMVLDIEKINQFEEMMDNQQPESEQELVDN